jgi:hypothetical protein
MNTTRQISRSCSAPGWNQASLRRTRQARGPTGTTSKYTALNAHGPTLVLQERMVGARTTAALALFPVAWDEFRRVLSALPANALWSIALTQGESTNRLSRAFEEVYPSSTGGCETELATLRHDVNVCDLVAPVLQVLLIDLVGRLPRHLQQPVAVKNVGTHWWCEVGEGPKAVVFDFWVALPEAHLQDEGFFSRQVGASVHSVWYPGEPVTLDWQRLRREGHPAWLSAPFAVTPADDPGWADAFADGLLAGEMPILWNRFESISGNTEREHLGMAANERTVYVDREKGQRFNGDLIDDTRLKEVLRGEAARRRSGFPEQALRPRIQALSSAAWLKTLRTHARRGDMLLVSALLRDAGDAARARHMNAAGLASVLRDVAGKYGGDDGQVIEVVHALLDAGASLDDADERGMTALMHACEAGHLALADALHAAGAGAELLASDGSTVLHLACSSWRADEMAAWLLTLPGLSARLTGCRDERGKTPADRARVAGRDVLAEDLADRAAGRRRED